MRYLLFLGMLVAATTIQAQTGTVQRVLAKDVYILNTPERSYEIEFQVGGGVKTTSFVTGGLVNESISEKITKFVGSANSEDKDYQALLYVSGKQILAVNYTDSLDSRKAKVQELEGMPVYVLCEPDRAYEVVVTIGGGIKMKSLVTAGLSNNSIEEDMIKFVKGVKRRNDVEAIVYTSGKKAVGIRFTN